MRHRSYSNLCSGVLGVLFVFMAACAHGQSPLVTGVSFTQGPNGGGTQVDIAYSLDAPNGPCTIAVSLSKDGGVDGFSHPVTSITGDTGGVTTGTGKHIVWDVAADYPNEGIATAVIRVTADDGGLTAYGDSATGAIETVWPTVLSVTVQAGLVIDIAFSEPMAALGVMTPANYTVSGAGSGSLASNPSSVVIQGGNTYRLTWLSGEMVNGGGIAITAANVQDTVGNAIAAPNSGNGTGFGTPPNATVITPITTSPTNADNIVFEVVFDEPVQGFNDAADLIVGLTGAVSMGAIVTGGPAAYSVDVTGIIGDGSITLAVSTSSNVTDLVGNPLATSATSAAVVIDNTLPTVSISTPSTSLTMTGPVTYTVTYGDSGAMSVTLSSGDITLNGSGTAFGTVAVTGSDLTRTVTISGISGDGALGISIVPGTAVDSAGNPALGVGPSATFQVVSTPPVTVPDVVGQTQAAATSAITGAGLVVGTTTNGSSADQPVGNVYRQNPAAGVSVGSGTAVNIVVAANPSPARSDPVWPWGTNPVGGANVSSFCDAQQAFMNNSAITALFPPEYQAFFAALAPDGDVNGTSFVIQKDPYPDGLLNYQFNGNGKNDCRLELRLIGEVLKATFVDIPAHDTYTGLTHPKVLHALNVNAEQFEQDVGTYWPLFFPLLNGFPQILLGHMLIGDGDATFSDPQGAPPTPNRIDGHGSAGFVKAAMFLLNTGGMAMANPEIDLGAYARMPEFFSMDGDADGDGFTNECEYNYANDLEAFPGLTADERIEKYVAYALDPAKQPPVDYCGATLLTLPVIGQDGGSCDAVAMQGDYAFICEGQALRVVDVSTPSSPKPLGQLVFNRMFHNIVVQGGYAYVALEEEGVAVVDIANPLAPVRVGTFALPNSEVCSQVAVSGRYAYVVGYSATTSVATAHAVDIGDPAQPHEAGLCSLETMSKPVGICVSGHWAFITHEASASLVVVDIANPTAPVVAGTWEAPNLGDSITQCVMGPENYLYVAGNPYVYLLLTSTSFPFSAWTFIGPGADGLFLSVLGNNLYVYAHTPSLLRMMDIASPVDPGTPPATTGSISIPGSAKGVASSLTSSGRLVACVADGVDGLRVVDVSAPSSPVEIPYIGVMPKQRANATAYWQPRLVSVSGSYACVIDCDKGMVVYDVSDAAHPQAKSTWAGGTGERDQMVSVFLDGNVAYLSENVDGMRAIDISNPASPFSAGPVFYPGTANVGQVCVSEGYAYLATSQGVYIVNVQNPSAMYQVNRIGTTFVYSVYVVGNYLFVDALDIISNSVKHMYDITTPGSPSEVSTASPTAFPSSDLVVSNSHMYGTNQGASSVDVFDVSGGILENSTSLTTLGLSSPGGLAASGDVVFITTDAANPGVLANTGVLVIDASSGFSPIGTALPERHVSSLSVAGDKCYAAGTDSGFTILGGALPAVTVDPLPAFIYAEKRWILVTGTAPAGALVSIGGGRFPVVEQLSPGDTHYSIQVPLWENSVNYLSVATLTDSGLIGVPTVRRVVEGSEYPTTPQNVTRLDITPASPEVVLNDGLQFTCWATFDSWPDAEDVTPYVAWRDVANEEVVTGSGLYTNTREGTAVIRASIGTLSSNSVSVTDLPGPKVDLGNVQATVQLMGVRPSATVPTITANTLLDWTGDLTIFNRADLYPTVSVPSGLNRTSNTGWWKAAQKNYYFKAEASAYITQAIGPLALAANLPTAYIPLAFTLVSSTAAAPVVQFLQPTGLPISGDVPIKVVLCSANSYLKLAAYTVTKTVGMTTTTVVPVTNITIPSKANTCFYSTVYTLGSGTTIGAVFTFTVTAMNYSASNDTTSGSVSFVYNGSGAGGGTTLPSGAVDSDGDGLPDWLELALGTSSSLKDTDGDGLWDGDEYYLYRTDPKASDSNGDGISDGDDVAAGRDPVIDKRVQMKVIAPVGGSTVYGNDIRLVARTMTGVVSDIVSVLFEKKGPSPSDAWTSVGTATESPFVVSATSLAPGSYLLRASATTLLGLVAHDPTPPSITVSSSLLTPIQETTVGGVHQLIVPVTTADNTIVFALANGAVLTLTIPAGAIDSPGATLTLQSPSGAAYPTPTSLQSMTGIDFTASLSSSQTVLNKLATMSIAYPNPAHDGTLNGAPGQWLAIEYLNLSPLKLERLASPSMDLVTASVTAKTDHFSTFALVTEAPAMPLMINVSGVLPTAQLGVGYTFTLGASGGTDPYTWAQTVGELPQGLELAVVKGDTMIVGMPTYAGDYLFGLSVTDDSGTTKMATYTIHVPLSVSIGDPSVNLTTAGPVDFIVTYTGAENITLSPANVLLQPGPVTGDIAVSGTDADSRTVRISNIQGTGTLAISLPVGTANNLGGALAVAAGPSAICTVDNTAPTPVISGETTPTNTTRTLTIDFGEVVNGFVLGMVLVNNGTLSNLQPSCAASSYTVDVLGLATGPVSVSIAGSVVTDQVGNANNPTGSPFIFQFDGLPVTGLVGLGALLGLIAITGIRTMRKK